jgi:hypothetical protein
MPGTGLAGPNKGAMTTAAERRSSLGGSTLVLAAFVALFCGGLVVYGWMHGGARETAPGSSAHAASAAAPSTTVGD